jgi:hypothetical protein
MSMYKIRVTAEVLETVNATRRVNVDGRVLTFGREPVYLQADELPPQLVDDRYLMIEAVDSAPSGAEVIDLKAERVQEESVAPGDESDLELESVQEEVLAPAAAAAPVSASSSRKRR